MDNKELISNILEASTNGVITTKDINSAGLHRNVLQKLVNTGELTRFGRGLYIRNNVWEDDFYMLQSKYSRGVFSHETALYLWGYTDRTPSKYTLTFPKGYNTPSLEKENVIIKRSILENYNLGITEVQSPSGNLIRIYDLERSLCDILRGNNNDIQIVNAAMKKYAASKDKDIYKLMKYAEQLHVKPKVLRYMEVLL